MKTNKLIEVTSRENDIVQYDNQIAKDLQKLPDFIIEKLKFWAKSVNCLGIAKVRELKGFHDESLKGN